MRLGFLTTSVGLLRIAVAQSAVETSNSRITSTTAGGSSTITSRSSASTARGTGPRTRSTPTIQLPPLVQCSYATFSFTCPENLVGLPKHLGFYPSSASAWIETLHLGTQYDELSEGTFSWLVDLPVGLSVAAMFYVTDPEKNGAIPTNGSASTSDTVILAGTKSDCLAGNAGASTSSIVAIASDFDPTFVWTGAQASPTGSTLPNTSSGGGISSGAIVGAVIGGIALVAMIAIFLFCVKRRHDQKIAARDNDGYSVYSEKPHMWTTSAGIGGSVHGLPIQEPPPGTYWSQDEQGNPILIALAGGGLPQPGTPDAQQQHYTAGDSSMSEVDYMSTVQSPVGPRRTAPMGTLPEPMGDDDDSQPLSPIAEYPRSSTPPNNSAAFVPQSESRTRVSGATALLRGEESVVSQDQSSSTTNVFQGAEGLDDPNSFAVK
ncbi:hypothetical protein OIO90_004762 [Microbotryomycetes sp. JL221]|nr:hypothetical protein OIO90_004762 [Microbotryomycetes sp. JL221]